jgi:nitroimidazol reductase NimA-like FMN-containing flavoprotein (pyridoxamine 5'-phosphate oxidase superfamily)
MLGILSQKRVEEVLRHQIIGRIGCHADGLTYVVPISYAYDGIFIYGHSQQGMKLNIMRDNPRICFQVDIIQNMATWESVIVMGLFEELKGDEERKKAIWVLNGRMTPLVISQTMKITPDWPFDHNAEPDMIKGVLFRIRPLEKTGRYENTL